MKIYVPLSLAVFLTFPLFAEEVHSFYISNHDQSPSHRVIHPIVGKTNFVYDAKGLLEEVCGEGIAFLIRDCENVTIRNLRLDYARPMLAEAKIAGFEGGKTILDYDRKRCPMMVKDGRLFMVGEGFTNRVRSCRLFDGKTYEQTPEAKDVFLAENTFVRLADGKISVDADLSKYGVGCKVGDVRIENRIVGEDGMVTKHPKASSLQIPFPCKLETKLFYVGRVVDVVTNSFAVPIR